MSIFYNEEFRTFFLDGKNITYAFRVNHLEYLEHLYFGKKIHHDDLGYTSYHSTQSFVVTAPDKKGGWGPSYNFYSPELSFFGCGDFREPCVMVENQQGDRMTNLLYEGYEILQEKPRISGMPSMEGKETLIVHLVDKISLFCADLYYTVYDDCDTIARRIVYKNLGRTNVTLDRAYSFSFALPSVDYDVMSLHGSWARERKIQRVPLSRGVISIDSKRCTSSAILNPFVAVMDKEATETHGDVWGFSLVYSSSYVLKVQGTEQANTIVTGGINDFDFSWELPAGEVFETPEVVIAFSGEGLGGMSRAFHDAFRNHLINPRYVRHERPFVINNWEATYFDFDDEKLKSIIDVVAGTGVNTFVLDDGWFGQRNDETSSLGDWVVNTEKLKDGLKGIIDYTHSKGMKFGLWIEPEMISERSELYKKHSDYTIKIPGRTPCTARNQYMLDLTREDVRDYIVDAINSILKNNEIDYVKWDYNRNVTDAYSLGLPPHRQKEFAHRYALGLYDLCDRIILANPDVFFEGCSGGGARFDPAMLYYFPQIWTSDNTDANERVLIQYGTSVVYPLSSMSAHVSECPNHVTARTTPISTRADISHLASPGYELDTTRMLPQEKELIASQVEEYKKCSELILCGDVYRIDDPFNSNYMSVSVVSKDKSKAFLLTYQRLYSANYEAHRVKMQGLDPDKRYFIRELGIEVGGSTIMNVGIVVNFPKGDFNTIKYHFDQI